MRNYLCNEEDCREDIAINYRAIEELKEEISTLEEDIRNDIQRHPRDNQGSIDGLNYLNFRYYQEILRAKYSIGESISAMEEDFAQAIYHLEHVGEERVGYVNLLWMVSLGILLEIDRDHLKRLSKVIQQKDMNDFVIDYLLCASDIGWNKISRQFVKEIPYAKTKEIIELAYTDKTKASQRLQIYMDKEWFQGHYDYGWKNDHKESGYLGFWSFETAAIAKIFDLDDSGLQGNIHYPYDLAHYKQSMAFKQVTINDYLEAPEPEETEEWVEGIDNNPALEEIIPIRWHAFINELIEDYQTLEDEAFYQKYKEPMELEQIWFLFELYKEENKDRNLLGTLIVFALTQRYFIMQLDYKDDLEDYVRFIKDSWQDTETKTVQFILHNDQQYVARVPVDANVKQMYEVDIKDIEVEQSNNLMGE